MLNRQDSLLSSSHRQTPPPEHHQAKPIGCMSAIFKLFSKYQNRKKLLTFGKKHEKNAVSTPTKSIAPLEQKDCSSVDNKNIDEKHQNFETKKITCDVTPRSPMLPPEIRRPNALNSSENTRTPPTLVAQLMGLEDHQQQKQPMFNRNIIVDEEISTEEKRLKLLQALEKCNEDLESLKKIIMAVQSAGKCPQIPSSVVVNKLKEESLAKTCMKRTAEQLRRMSNSNVHKIAYEGIMQQHNKQMPGKKPGEDDSISISFFNKAQAQTLRKKHKATTPTFCSSKSMIQSVDEVCNDIVWGEKRELGNIGLVLQNYICRDLIEEVVFDLGFHKMHYLPFEACKRRLSF